MNDTTAQDYYVLYKFFMNIVAFSEIFATCMDDTIRGIILAIIFFTLNRVYTEWYRNVH